MSAVHAVRITGSVHLIESNHCLPLPCRKSLCALRMFDPEAMLQFIRSLYQEVITRVAPGVMTSSGN